MMIELKEEGLSFETKKATNVLYKHNVVGLYFPDLIVEGKVIVELKAAESLIESHRLQILNYIKATDIPIGLLLNFGKVPTIKRAVLREDLIDR
jgi:GxxExxY protein